ncbi:toll/interleukin-1 receptor domain-containing protein [Streptomyces sp. NPDC059578]|uniref:toll/interleukin-1 receptor domain-containing protein n=1 Tax=Streptomyces sp. NPDC059578 TaxID=3346874 RepID=UPI0036C7F498
MKIFISWSGETARKCAEVLGRELGHLHPEMRAFVSSLGIAKGQRSMESIAAELRGADVGIMCLTRENQRKQWINYEAGALSRQTNGGKAYVHPFLIDMSPEEISGPLKQFQATDSSVRREVLSMIQSLHDECVSPYSPEELRRAFEEFWDRTDRAMRDIKKRMSTTGTPVRATPEDLLGELVDLVRDQSRRIGALEEQLGTLGSGPVRAPARGAAAGGTPARAPTEEEDRTTDHTTEGVREIVGRTHLVQEDTHEGGIAVVCDGEGYRRANEKADKLRRLASWSKITIKVSHAEESVTFAPQ